MRRNQWTGIDWDSVSWNELGWQKKRERLFREANYACPKCGFNQRRLDGRHVLEIDHIDGNHKNETRENLRVLCPSCHALTPNFRNFGRSSKQKTGTRFRKGNKGYDEIRQLIREKDREYDENFMKVVTETHESKQIDYSKFGWVQRLSEKLNDPCVQVIGRKVRKLMPQFYVNHCFRRGKGTKSISV